MRERQRLACMPGLVAGVYDKWDRLQGQGRSRTLSASIDCQRIDCVALRVGHEAKFSFDTGPPAQVPVDHRLTV